MNYKQKSMIALAVMTALSSQVVIAADEANEEEIERLSVTGQLSHYSATKNDTPIMETSRSVSIESLQDLLDKGAFRVDDAYTYSAGVTGKTFGFATRGDWVRVRGLDVPQYQDSLQSLFGNYNNTRPDIYTLEQVEILKGPASVLYGKGSPGGLVNVVSKTPKAEARHEIVAEVGNYDRTQLAFDSTAAIDEDETWLYRLVGVHRDTDTQVDFVSEKTKVFAPSITWQPNSQSSITLLYNYTKTESDTAAQFLPIQGTLLPGPGGQYIDNSTYLGDPAFNKYDAETKAFTVLAEHEFNDEWRLEFTGRNTSASADYQQAWTSFLGFDNEAQTGIRYLPIPGFPLVPRTFYRNDATSDQTAVDVRLKGDISWGDWEHNVLFGAQYQDVETKGKGFSAWAYGLNFANPLASNTSYWINPFNPTYGRFPDAQEQAQLMQSTAYGRSSSAEYKDTGLYVSDQINYQNWSFNLGLRYDEITSEELGKPKQDDDALSYSVGVMYKFEGGFSPYMNYAESFEPVIGNSRQDGTGTPLKPQEGDQFELGIKYEMSSFPAFITLAYFDITQTNLSSGVSGPNEVNQQSGEAEIDGVELEAKATIDEVTLEVNLSHLNHKGALTAIRGSNPVEYTRYTFPSVPEDQASVWASYRPTGTFEGLRMGAGVRYVGSSLDGVDNLRTPSYTLADLMLGYEYNNWDFSLNIRNASDKEFQATCLGRGDCFPGERRTVVGRVTYAF